VLLLKRKDSAIPVPRIVKSRFHGCARSTGAHTPRVEARLFELLQAGLNLAGTPNPESGTPPPRATNLPNEANFESEPNEETLFSAPQTEPNKPGSPKRRHTAHRTQRPARRPRATNLPNEPNFRERTQ
jgi:hypothetical protein